MTDWQYEVIKTILWVVICTCLVCQVSDMISAWFKDKKLKPMARRKRK